MFVITKSKVEGYEVTINISVCDIYKTIEFFLFVLSEVFKAKKIKIRKKRRIIHSFVKYLNLLMTGSQAVFLYVSMTKLLMHTVAHSTKPYFMPKTNNQPPKMFLSLAIS